MERRQSNTRNVYIGLCCFCLLALLWLFGTVPVSAAAFNGSWKFYTTDTVTNDSLDLLGMHAGPDAETADWKPFAYPQRPPVPDGHRYAWLATQLPTVVRYHDPVLFFTTTEEAVRVYVDNELIYTYGEFGAYHRTYGKKWHLVPLPGNYIGRQLTFQLYSDHPGRLGVVRDLSLNEGIYQFRQIFRHDLIGWMMLPLTFILLVIMVLAYQVMRQRRRLYIYLAIFLAFLGAWLTSSLWASLLLLNRPTFWSRQTLLSGYLLPVFGNLIVYEVIEVKFHRWLRYIIGGYLLFYAGVLAGEGLGYNSLDAGVALFYGYLFIGQLLVAAFLLYSAWQGNKSSRALLVPVLGMPLIGILNGLWSHFHLFEASFYFMPLIVLFLAFFVVWILRENMRSEQRLSDLAVDLRHRMQMLREEAQIDALTKCFNRSKLDEAVQAETDVAEYFSAPLAVLMFDIDLFKSVNDTYGHDAGDQVLVRFASVIHHSLDARHVFIRYGGEEFVVLCRGFDAAAALALAEELRQKIAAAVLLEQRRVTCSVGVSVWHPHAGDSGEKLLKRADLALYAAKRGGRNRTALEHSTEE